MKKQLSHFRHMPRHTIANLEGMKSIMRVDSPRKSEWWLVLPACGDSDAVCVFLKKVSGTSMKLEMRGFWTESEQSKLLAEYADRILNA